MITFYFSGEPFNGRTYERVGDILRSVRGTAADIVDRIRPGERVVVVATFDDSVIPPRLTFRPIFGAFSFHDARTMREDFPKFYVGLGGDILDADSFSKEPVMRGPHPNIK